MRLLRLPNYPLTLDFSHVKQPPIEWYFGYFNNKMDLFDINKQSYPYLYTLKY